MDKSALKDKRRETVIGLLKGMSIKKGVGEGFDKDDVYDCVQQLTTLYEEHIEELEKNYESEIGEMTKRYHKYDENNELYVSLILEAKKSSNEIINQAKAEVDEILTNGKEQVALQERQLEQFKADAEREKELISEELKTRKDVAEAEKAAVMVEIEAEKEKLEATRNKYRQQIVAMEDEFAEIKTNILRTSARLDSLKAQTEEIDTSIVWSVDETKNPVQIPAADVEVDNVIEVSEQKVEVVQPGAEETYQEEPTEEPISQDLFVETFFKSEILDNAPTAAKAESLENSHEESPTDNAEAEPKVSEEPIESTEITETSEQAEEIEAVAEADVPAADEPEEDSKQPMQESELFSAFENLTNKMSDELEIEEAAETESIEALLDEISFDGLVDQEQAEAETIDGDAPKGIEQIEELTLEDLEGMEGIEDVNLEGDMGADADEISFEGLEALFKDEQ